MDFYSLIDLGNENKAREFFKILFDQGELFIPERISQTEPVRGRFDKNNLDDAVRLWIDKGKNPEVHSSCIMMVNTKPLRTSIMVSWSRSAHATFNSIVVWIGQKYISKNYGIEPLLSFGESLFDYTGAFYGFISRIDVEEAQFVAGTLQTRLPGVYWANFFGPLYIDFFGKEKIENAPCYQKKKITDGIVLLTAKSPTGLENIADRVFENDLRTYLNNDAFPDIAKEKKDYYTPEELRAGLHNIRIQHNTPVFDFSELRKGFTQKIKTIEEEKKDAVKNFTRIGWQFVRELESGTLEFKDKKGGVLRFTAGPNGSADHFPFGLPDYLK